MSIFYTRVYVGYHGLSIAFASSASIPYTGVFIAYIKVSIAHSNLLLLHSRLCL